MSLRRRGDITDVCNSEKEGTVRTFQSRQIFSKHFLKWEGDMQTSSIFDTFMFLIIEHSVFHSTVLQTCCFSNSFKFVVSYSIPL